MGEVVGEILAFETAVARTYLSIAINVERSSQAGGTYVRASVMIATLAGLRWSVQPQWSGSPSTKFVGCRAPKMEP